MISIAEQNIFGDFPTKSGFSFREVEVTPANPKAIEYAEAVCAMLQARMALDDAQKNVPNYTAQWRDSDYYSNEEETYNRACDNLYKLAKENS